MPTTILVWFPDLKILKEFQAIDDSHEGIVLMTFCLLIKITKQKLIGGAL